MKSLKQQGFYYGALLYAFLIPFPQKLINIALIVWLALSLFSFRKSALVKNKWLWLLPAFYLTYFIGLFTAETNSFKFLEYKLSLLVFPLVFFLHAYDDKQRSDILKFLVLGLIASIGACVLGALVNSFSMDNGAVLFQPNVLEGKGFMESILYGGNYFFGRYLSIFHQTVYYAMYLCAGVAILLFRPNLFSQKLRIVFLGVLLLFIFLVSNKASFIVLGLIFAIKIWSWQVSKSRKLIGLAFFALLIATFIFFNPRMKQSAQNAAEGQLKIDKDARYGFSTRLLSWDTAISLIKEKPLLGYGNSNTQDALNKAYEEKGYVFPLRESYNAHNLWLQSWLENGLMAIIILVGIFWALTKKIFNDKVFRPLLLSFVAVLLVNSLFEGLFNRFSGISFFAFLFCFIVSKLKGGQLTE